MVQPLWNMMEWKSLGMMTFPTEWNVIKKNVPNDQPVMTSYNMLLSLTRYTPLSSVQKPVSSLYTIWLRMGFRVHWIVIIPNILVIIGEYNAIYNSYITYIYNII